MTGCAARFAAATAVGGEHGQFHRREGAVNSKLRRTSAGVAVLVFVGALLQPFGGDAAARSNRHDKLQGTWRVQLKPRNCDTGAPLPSFSVLLSFARGGTLTEVMNAQAFLPGQRTPGLGVWSRTHRNAYKGVWDAFILFDSPVFKRGVQRLTWDFNVVGDEMTVEASSLFFDTIGSEPVEACASGTGTRFEHVGDDD
jgi:hypothetical protein